jgi:uncharacterized OsmC-like protein
MAPSDLSAPITVTHEDGVRFVARARTHEIPTDQKLSAGGEDSAPTPLELIAAGLGTCIALYVHQFCHVRELPCEGLMVEVRHQIETSPWRIGKFLVRLTLPADLPPEYRTMISRVVRTCPAHNTLVHGAGVTVDIISPIPELVEA